MMSLAFSRRAGFKTALIDCEFPCRICTGFQPISAAFLMACAANFAEAKSTKMFAPENFSFTNSESIVVAQVLPIDACFALIAWLEAHRPRICLLIAEDGSSGSDEQLWYVFGVDI